MAAKKYSRDLANQTKFLILIKIIKTFFNSL